MLASQGTDAAVRAKGMEILLDQGPAVGRAVLDVALRHHHTGIALQIAGGPTAQNTAWLRRRAWSEASCRLIDMHQAHHHPLPASCVMPIQTLRDLLAKSPTTSLRIKVGGLRREIVEELQYQKSFFTGFLRRDWEPLVAFVSRARRQGATELAPLYTTWSKQVVGRLTIESLICLENWPLRSPYLSDIDGFTRHLPRLAKLRHMVAEEPQQGAAAVLAQADLSQHPGLVSLYTTQELSLEKTLHQEQVQQHWVWWTGILRDIAASKESWLA